MKNNINNTNDFNQIFIKLNKEEKKELFNSFIQEKKFEELIDNGYNFSKICDYLNDEQIETIYKLIEPKFNNNNFFKKIEDYYGVFSAVPSTKKESFFEKVKERFSESINNFIDFHHTMKILTTEQLTNLCPLLDKKLKEIFTTISAPVILSTPSQNLEKLLYDDELDKNKLKVLENYITIFFKSGADFEAFVKELDEEDTVILFDSFKNRISSIVDSDMDLAMIFFYLEEPQVKEACELLKDKINNIIKSGKELKTLLLRIPDEIRPVVIESLKDNVINKIEFSDELATLFNHLEEPEIKKICETGKNGLNKFIKSNDVLKNILSDVSRNKRQVVGQSLFEVSKDKLINSIEAGSHIDKEFDYLSDDIRNKIKKSFFIKRVENAIADYDNRKSNKKEILFFSFNSQSQGSMTAKQEIFDEITKIKNNSKNNIDDLINTIKKHESTMGSGLKEVLTNANCLSSDYEELMKVSHDNKTANSIH